MRKQLVLGAAVIAAVVVIHGCNDDNKEAARPKVERSHEAESHESIEPSYELALDSCDVSRIGSIEQVVASGTVIQTNAASIDLSGAFVRLQVMDSRGVQVATNAGPTDYADAGAPVAWTIGAAVLGGGLGPYECVVTAN